MATYISTCCYISLLLFFCFEVSISNAYSDENTSSFKDANDKVIKDMLAYAGTIQSKDIPAKAREWIIEKLKSSGPLKNFHSNVQGNSNQVVQVENVFEGKDGHGKAWEIIFTISADMPNPKLKQKAHFGCDVYLNKKRAVTTHKWLPDGLLKLGRPDDPNFHLEVLKTQLETKTFDAAGSANWITKSKKHK